MLFHDLITEIAHLSDYSSSLPPSTDYHSKLRLENSTIEVCLQTSNSMNAIKKYLAIDECCLDDTILIPHLRSYDNIAGRLMN